jgi:hypothetical protein
MPAIRTYRFEISATDAARGALEFGNGEGSG